MVTPLVEFLKARLDEDEERARHSDDGAWVGGDLFRESWHSASCGYGLLELMNACSCDVPERVLAEVAAKRAIIANFCRYDTEARATGHYMDVGASGYALEAVEALAAVYADHPDYDQEWR